MAITQTITVLPTPPSRADPTNFDTRADSFLSALPTMQTQMNTWADQANSTASETTNAVGDAEAAQAAAEAAQGTATTQAGIATTQAGIATTQAGTATTQAGTATTKAGEAAASAVTATTQAGTATTQAGTATTQAGIATTQAGIATTQAGTATTKAGEAAASAGTATTQAGTATTQAGIATTQAGTATTKAGEAAASAVTATTQAGTATTQAGIATTQAGTATTQAGIATTQAGIATTKAGEAAASAALAVDVVSGGLTSTTPAANKIPLADGAAKIALGWLDLTGYAPAAQGVTNGNSHDHNGGDGGQIAYASLSGLPTLGTAAATASSDYAPAAQGVTNGNSHDHNGGDGGQIAYANLSGLPTLGTAAATASSNYASASHAHGNITAAGAIGSTANLPVITTTSGALTVGAFGTGATNFTAGNDARLSDARTPTAHNQAETTITFTDVSTGNASTTAHGFAPKATAPASGLRSVMAIDNGETVRSDKALFDATNPAALGTASPGSAMTAARRDHVHPLPSVGEKLTAARTYYVRTDGNDANTGLANTSGGAFLTIGHAMAVARGINLSSYDLTIAVGAGTFTENLFPGPYVTEGGTIIVSGSGVGSTIINVSGGNAVEGYGFCTWGFRNLTFTAGDGNGVEANDGVLIRLDTVGFASVNRAAISCRQKSSIYLVTSVAFTGSSDNFISSTEQGLVQVDASITLSGTCAFSEFVYASHGSYVGIFEAITGTATGKRYDVSSNAVLNTDGAGSTYLPGNVAGTTATGGQYL